MSKWLRLAICGLMGESSSAIVVLSPGTLAGGRDGRKNVDSPVSFRSKTVGIDMPPGGPNVADFRPESMCGDEVECFNARR